MQFLYRWVALLIFLLQRYIDFYGIFKYHLSYKSTFLQFWAKKYTFV